MYNKSMAYHTTSEMYYLKSGNRIHHVVEFYWKYYLG